MSRLSVLRNRIASAVACLAIGWIAVSVVRSAVAGARRRSHASIDQFRSACEMDPGRADCWSELADAMENQGLDGSADWETAIQLNPRDAPTLVGAALAAESRGNLDRAEQLLLQAERYNHLWMPRWSLANFYLRRDRRPEFRRWMRLAFDRSYGDLTAAFRLCRAAGTDGVDMLGSLLPDDPKIIADYVAFLAQDKLVDDLEAAVGRYLDSCRGHNRKAESRAPAAAVEALVQAGRAQAAVRVWNLLCGASYLPYPAWTPEAPLTNGNFRTPLDFPGLDWRLPGGDGVSSVVGATPETVKFSLSGRQSEYTELLFQFVVLPGGRSYRLSFDFRTPGIQPPDSGLFWRVLETGGKEIAAGGPLLSTEEWAGGSVNIPAQSGERLLRLVLSAERRPGNTRKEGEAWLRNVKMEPAR